jgi:hypothetical protein
MAKYIFDQVFEQIFIEVCNNSRSMAQAAIVLKMNYKTLSNHAKRLGCFKTNQAGNGISKSAKSKIIPMEEIFSGQKSFQSHKLKKRLLKEQYKPHQCERCKLTTWENNIIPLELHHVDGNRYNNSLENLQLLCPNCHALTDNYRAKNIKKI